MKYNTLGNTNEKVSRMCLGTMTWGYQNTYEEAQQQMDYALSKGINFWDTAEVYAVPIIKENYGKTEEIIGKWFAKTGRRNEVFLASKMVGVGVNWVRESRGIIASDVMSAIDGSLKRLQTDVIDLYQLHWPQRQTNTFAKLDYDAAKFPLGDEENMFNVLKALEDAVSAGKIRYVGLSNETAYGMMKYAQYHNVNGLVKMQSVQNPYSLVQRIWDIGNSEVAMHENMGLLAYSPLAGGILSGKYLNGKTPEGARYSTWGKSRMPQYTFERVNIAVQKYVDLALSAGITPVQMAIAWVNQRPSLTSNIIGATSLEQLKEVVSAEDITLSNDILEKIEEIHMQNPNPARK